MNAKDKLKILLEKEGRGAAKKLAEFLNVPRNYITRWAKDEKYNFPYEYIEQISKFFNVPASYFLETDEIPVTRYLPIIGEASCGVPTNHFYQDAEYEMYPVPEHLYKEGRYYVKAVGDSMLPKIKEGDIVLCDKEAYIDNGSIVHYTINGSESGIKKVICENNKPVMLQPLNPEYEPILIKDGDEVRMAKCLEVTSKL